MSKKTCSLRSSSSELHLEITPPTTCVYSETRREEQLIDLKGQAPGDRKLRNDGGSRKLPQRRNSWCGERKAHSSRLQSPRRLRDRRGLGHISARTDDHPPSKTLHLVTSLSGTEAPSRALLMSAASMKAIISRVSSGLTGGIPVRKNLAISPSNGP